MISIILGVVLAGEVAKPKTLLRVVERRLSTNLVAELALHEQLVSAEGWRVLTITAPKPTGKTTKTAHVDLANQIYPCLATNPGLHVFLIGSVPLPLSGNAIWPDQHGNSNGPTTAGAYACPAYYVTPGPYWTDAYYNPWNFNARFAHLVNVPGDGKWDQEWLPTNAVQGSIGVLYLDKLRGDTFGSTAEWPLEGYRRYFANIARHRTNPTAWKTLAADGNSGIVKLWDDPNTVFRRWALAEMNIEPPMFRRALPTSRDLVAFTTLEPIMVVSDFKVDYTPLWERGVNVGFETYFASYSLMPDSPPLSRRIGAGALAVGNWLVGHYSYWNFSYWVLDGLAIDKTIGEVWTQSIRRSRGTSLVLIGDPTLTFY